MVEGRREEEGAGREFWEWDVYGFIAEDNTVAARKYLIPWSLGTAARR
jgi:hypothetical protein